ncbi:MAG: hypothetical protein V4662_26995 [Verrucomicrobiota bacterium]
MKLIPTISLLITALLTSCAGPVDYRYAGYSANTGYSGYSSPPHAYNTGYCDHGTSRHSSASDNSSNLWPAIGAAALAYWAIGGIGEQSSSTSEDYDRCELCSEPTGAFSGRWCDHHASVVQEQMNQGR